MADADPKGKSTHKILLVPDNPQHSLNLHQGRDGAHLHSWREHRPSRASQATPVLFRHTTFTNPTCSSKFVERWYEIKQHIDNEFGFKRTVTETELTLLANIRRSSATAYMTGRALQGKNKYVWRRSEVRGSITRGGEARATIQKGGRQPTPRGCYAFPRPPPGQVAAPPHLHESRGVEGLSPGSTLPLRWDRKSPSPQPLPPANSSIKTRRGSQRSPNRVQGMQQTNVTKRLFKI